LKNIRRSTQTQTEYTSRSQSTGSHYRNKHHVPCEQPDQKKSHRSFQKELGEVLKHVNDKLSLKKSNSAINITRPSETQTKYKAVSQSTGKRSTIAAESRSPSICCNRSHHRNKNHVPRENFDQSIFFQRFKTKPGGVQDKCLIARKSNGRFQLFPKGIFSNKTVQNENCAEKDMSKRVTKSSLDILDNDVSNSNGSILINKNKAMTKDL